MVTTVEVHGIYPILTAAGDLVLYDEDICPCCSGAIDCTGSCDCGSVPGICLSALNYLWRYGAGDMKNCDPNCNDLIDDKVVAEGGGVGGPGILLKRILSTDCCSYIADTLIHVGLLCCDCGTGEVTPSAGPTMVLNTCQLVSGLCVVQAQTNMCGGQWEIADFDLDAPITAPNVFINVTTLLCCNTPTTIEIWKA